MKNLVEPTSTGRRSTDPHLRLTKKEKSGGLSVKSNLRIDIHIHSWTRFIYMNGGSRTVPTVINEWHKSTIRTMCSSR